MGETWLSWRPQVRAHGILLASHMQESFQPSPCVTICRPMTRRYAAFMDRMDRSTTIEYINKISVLN
jgi:hypothetical protein